MKRPMYLADGAIQVEFDESTDHDSRAVVLLPPGHELYEYQTDEMKAQYNEAVRGNYGQIAPEVIVPEPTPEERAVIEAEAARRDIIWERAEKLRLGEVEAQLISEGKIAPRDAMREKASD